MAKIGSVNIDLLKPEFDQSNKLMTDSLKNLVVAADPLKAAIDNNVKYIQNDKLGQLKDLAKLNAPQNPNDPGELAQYMQTIQQGAGNLDAGKWGINANNINEVTNLGISNQQSTLKDYLANQNTGLDVRVKQDEQRTNEAYNEAMTLFPNDPDKAEQYFLAKAGLGNSFNVRKGMAETAGLEIQNYANSLNPTIQATSALTGYDAATDRLNLLQQFGIDVHNLEKTQIDQINSLFGKIESIGGAGSAKTTAPGGSSSYSNSGSAGAGSGFGAVVNKGESGAAAYNAVNYGSGKGSGTVDASSMTVGQVVQQMNAGKLAAFGKYQFNVGSFPEAVTKLKLDPNAKMTPEMQDTIFANWYAGDKRPAIKNYITGKSNDVNKAITSASAEWRALQNIDGKIYKEDGHNKATITPETTKAGLDASRKAYAAAIKAGHSEADAYRIAITNADSVLGGSSVNTATSNPSSYTSKTDKELIGTSKVISNNSNYSALAKRSSDLIRLMGHHLDRSGKVIKNDDKFKAYSKEYAEIKSAMKQQLGKDFPEWEKVTKAMWKNAFNNMDARAAKEKGGTTSTGNSAPSIPQGQSPFKVSKWSNSVGGKELKSRLKIKQNESVAAGSVNKSTAEFAEIVQGQLGDNLKYFSAFNDSYHQGKKSHHTSGSAFDVVLKDGTTKDEAKAATANIRKMAAAAGYEVRILDEYNDPSKGSTGGHIHVTVVGTTTPGGSAALDSFLNINIPQLAASAGMDPALLEEMFNKARAGVEEKRSLLKDTLEMIGPNPGDRGFGLSANFKPSGFGGSLGFSLPGAGLDKLYARQKQALEADASLVKDIDVEANKVSKEALSKVEEILGDNFEISKDFINQVETAREEAAAAGKPAMPISSLVNDFEGFKKWLSDFNMSEETFKSLPGEQQAKLINKYVDYEATLSTDKIEKKQLVEKETKNFVHPKHGNKDTNLQTVMPRIEKELFNLGVGDLPEVGSNVFRTLGSVLGFNSQEEEIKENQDQLNRFVNSFSKEFKTAFLAKNRTNEYQYLTEEDLTLAAKDAWSDYSKLAKMRGGKKPWEALKSGDKHLGIKALHNIMYDRLDSRARVAAKRFNKATDTPIVTPGNPNNTLLKETINEIEKSFK